METKQPSHTKQNKLNSTEPKQNKTAVAICNETEQIIQTTVKNKVHHIKQSPPFTSVHHPQHPQSLSYKLDQNSRLTHADTVRRGEKPTPNGTGTADTRWHSHRPRNKERESIDMPWLMYDHPAGQLRPGSKVWLLARDILPDCHFLPATYKNFSLSSQVQVLVVVLLTSWSALLWMRSFHVKSLTCDIRCLFENGRSPINSSASPLAAASTGQMTSDPNINLPTTPGYDWHDLIRFMVWLEHIWRSYMWNTYFASSCFYCNF